MKNIVYPLEDGKFLHSHMGKYGSGLLIIADREDLPLVPYSWSYFNDHRDEYETTCSMMKIVDRWMGCYVGDFFFTKKGKPAFRLNPDGNHVLVVDDFDGERGYTSRLDILPEKDRMYFKRSLSNGGGAGKIWCVLPREYKAVFNMDEI